ncbi:uncharacterized protein MELLADRAFT_112410 [Melampsora larici-populina 98AG31]|uniref:Uncharacterized protein n=1 Tax=Melampsora larici-populina (strain 98AG31 / pathotype 3-4-7) TaxID=747676 RepID=F4S6E0_MELLP|nr:uncharacterized protein MELLADRAFT_112410 [Melampsora larici-populina 98AG31]EGF99793.1 hypothetical protein MELLADRAFT_112410 [Melampsora larici-populina 98AG31]
MAPHSNSSLQARLTKPKGSLSTFHGPPPHSASTSSTSFRRPAKAKFHGQRLDDLRIRGSSSHQKPLFGPGSKKSNITDPSIVAETTAEMGFKPSPQPLPLQSDSPPQPSRQIPNGISIETAHVDESSDDDDDDEAIADALLGRASNPRILLGRLHSLHPPVLGHKEDGEVSDEDPTRILKVEGSDVLSRRTSLLARMGADQPSHISGGAQNQADPTSNSPGRLIQLFKKKPDRQSIQQPSLLDRIPLPTAPRAHLHSNADRRVLAERNARAPNSHVDHHDRYHELDTSLEDQSSISRRVSSQGCEGPRRSSVSSLKRHSLYTVDESKDHRETGSPHGYISPTMNKGDGDADERGSNASFHSHTRKTKENTSFGSSAHHRPSVSAVPNQTLPTAPSSSLTHRIDTKSDNRDGRSINDQHGAQSALLARIGDQSIASSGASHQSSILAPVGLRDRLGLANTSASTVATTSKSLLERTIPKMQHPPPLQLARRSPETTSSSELYRSSRYGDQKPAADRVLSPRTASSADWRHASYSSHPKRRHYSRSRSPVGRRSRYSPIPLSAHSRGRSPPSPRHRHSRSMRYSRSPPGFDRRRSPPRGPRGYRRPSSPAHSVSSRRREPQHSPPRAPYSAREYHHRRNFSSSQHSASAIPPINSETRGRLGSRDTHVPDTNSSRDNLRIKPPTQISILISNLPSSLELKPFDVYQHLTDSLYREHTDPSIPYELTLYRFAGTSRICGELRFHREEDARTFEKKAIRRWKDEWDDGQKSSSERRVEFVVVDRDRAPWPGKHCTYKYKHNGLGDGTITTGSGSTFHPAPDESSTMTNSANASLKDEASSNTKEVGPPTPTSFKSNPICPPSPKNRLPPDEQRTGVLISSLRPSTNISVLHSLFIVPTRPRNFRIFQPSHISYGTILLDEHERKLACLLKFKDSVIAQSFFRVLLDNAPFQPMEASLVQFESVHFSNAIPIGGSSDPPQEEEASPDPPRGTREELTSPPLGSIAQLPAKPSGTPPSPIGLQINRILAMARPPLFQPNAHLSPDFSHHHSSTDFSNHFIPSPFYNNFSTADHHLTSSGSMQPSVPIPMLTPEEHRAYELRQTILARRSNPNPNATHSNPDVLYDNLRLNSPHLMNYPSQTDVYHEYEQDYLENGQHH